MTRGTHQATTRHLGAVEGRPRPALVWGPPGPPLTHLSPTPFSLPTIHTTIAQTRVLAALARDFSISLLSPSLLLKFRPFALRYVTPPCIQVEFCLVEYTLSILLL
jgi:hypothetical protein